MFFIILGRGMGFFTDLVCCGVCHQSRLHQNCMNVLTSMMCSFLSLLVPSEGAPTQSPCPNSARWCCKTFGAFGACQHCHPRPVRADPTTGAGTGARHSRNCRRFISLQKICFYHRLDKGVRGQRGMCVGGDGVGQRGMCVGGDGVGQRGMCGTIKQLILVVPLKRPHTPIICCRGGGPVALGGGGGGGRGGAGGGGQRSVRSRFLHCA